MIEIERHLSFEEGLDLAFGIVEEADEKFLEDHFLSCLSCCEAFSAIAEECTTATAPEIIA